MKTICILGCGAWGTAVARLIANNTINLDDFNDEVLMYVEDLKLESEPLTDVINRTHVNFHYLPGFKLPENVRATSNLDEVCQKSDILAIVYPARLLNSLLIRLKDKVKPDAYFISFCKGLIMNWSTTSVIAVSDAVRQTLSRPCYCVIGATTPMEVAWQHFTEATIGCADKEKAVEIKRLMRAPYFGLTVSQDELGVELCGAMKHVVAVAAGIIDGLALGDNTKSAVLRIGFWEMFELMTELFPNRGISKKTMYNSCGMAELFICMSHRSDKPPSVGHDMDLINIYVGRSLVKYRRRGSVANVPTTLQPTSTHADGSEYARIFHEILLTRNRLNHFPLFTVVHEIANCGISPECLIERLRNHPIHVL